MRSSGRKRASLVLLLVLAAGLAAAGTGAAAGSQEMLCCPEGMSEPAGCAWLGAGDCCTQAPMAPAPSQSAPPAPALCAALTATAGFAAPAAIPASAFTLPSAQAGLRTTVLRL